MYQILIETSLPDLLVMLLRNNQIIDYIHQKNLIKKSEVLPHLFQQLLNKHNLETYQIGAFYITLGPGSFMGARVACVFARTICQITHAHLYVTNTLHFISGGQDGIYYIDAQSNQSYMGIVKNGHVQLSLQPHHSPSMIDYQVIIDDIAHYLSLFTKVDDLLKIEPVYLKNPKVG